MDDPTRDPQRPAEAGPPPAPEPEPTASPEPEPGQTAAPQPLPVPTEPIAPVPPAAAEPAAPPPTAWAPPAGQSAAPPPPPPPTAWESPEEVAGPAPGYAYGGAGERLVAYIIDGLIITVLEIATLVVGLLLAVLIPVVGVMVWVVGLPLVGLAYFPWFWSRSGQTPGLKLFALRVVRDRDGGPVSGGQAILRLIGYWIDSVVFYIGFIWIFIDKRKRCWHDLIAGTVVIKRL